MMGNEDKKAQKLEKIINRLKTADNFYVVFVEKDRVSEFGSFNKMSLNQTLHFVKIISQKVGEIWNLIDDIQNS